MMKLATVKDDLKKETGNHSDKEDVCSGKSSFMDNLMLKQNLQCQVKNLTLELMLLQQSGFRCCKIQKGKK